MLALRGDPPRGETEWTPHPGGLSYSVELIAADRASATTSASAPRASRRSTPRRPTASSDLRYAREKVEAGAGFLITQLFFDNELYFDFVEQARAAGIDVPIVPGIMPITNYGQIKRFTEMCGASIPDALERELNGRADDPEAVAELGVAYATLQCADLLARGAPGIHFYTLNRSPATRSILAALRAAPPGRRAGATV